MKEKNEREPACDDEFNAKFIDIDISLNAHTHFTLLRTLLQLTVQDTQASIQHKIYYGVCACFMHSSNLTWKHNKKKMNLKNKFTTCERTTHTAHRHTLNH